MCVVLCVLFCVASDSILDRSVSLFSCGFFFLETWYIYYLVRYNGTTTTRVGMYGGLLPPTTTHAMLFGYRAGLTSRTRRYLCSRLTLVARALVLSLSAALDCATLPRATRKYMYSTCGCSQLYCLCVVELGSYDPTSIYSIQQLQGGQQQ